jgi:hypothetical protein
VLLADGVEEASLSYLAARSDPDDLTGRVLLSASDSGKLTDREHAALGDAPLVGPAAAAGTTHQGLLVGPHLVTAGANVGRRRRGHKLDSASKGLSHLCVRKVSKRPPNGTRTAPKRVASAPYGLFWQHLGTGLRVPRATIPDHCFRVFPAQRAQVSDAIGVRPEHCTRKWPDSC